jgi:hypothetical protein
MNRESNGLIPDDPVIFEHFGRAYREQAITLIEICRLYTEASPQTYTEDDNLQK